MLSQFRKTKPQHVINSQVSKVSVRLSPGGWSDSAFNLISPGLFTHVHSFGGLVGAQRACPRGQTPLQPTYLPTYIWNVILFSSL